MADRGRRSPWPDPVARHEHTWEKLDVKTRHPVLRCTYCGLAEPVRRYANGHYRHGSSSMYVNFKCRCWPCRAHAAEYKRVARGSRGRDR